MISIIRIIIIVENEACLMNKNGKSSYLEDLDRIKSGYMPRNRFIFIYNIIPIFSMTKLIVSQSYKKYIKYIIYITRPQKSHSFKKDF